MPHYLSCVRPTCSILSFHYILRSTVDTDEGGELNHPGCVLRGSSVIASLLNTVKCSSRAQYRTTLRRDSCGGGVGALVFS